MKVIIQGLPKEITTFALDIQGRQNKELNDWAEKYLNHRSLAAQFRSKYGMSQCSKENLPPPRRRVRANRKSVNYEKLLKHANEIRNGQDAITISYERCQAEIPAERCEERHERRR